MTTILTCTLCFSIFFLVMSVIIAFLNDFSNFLDTLASILFAVGLIGTISCVISLLLIAPTQHYRIQYMNSNGEVIIVEDAINVDYKKDSNGLVEYECDGDRYTIKSNFIEIKEKKNK